MSMRLDFIHNDPDYNDKVAQSRELGMSVKEAQTRSYPDGGGKYLIAGEYYRVHCDEYHMHSFKCLSKC